jgi:hypothetical protein
LSTISVTLYAVFFGANDAFFHPGLDASKTIHGIQAIVSKLRRAGASVSPRGLKPYSLNSECLFNLAISRDDPSRPCNASFQQLS